MSILGTGKFGAALLLGVTLGAVAAPAQTLGPGVGNATASATWGPVFSGLSLGTPDQYSGATGLASSAVTDRPGASTASVKGSSGQSIFAQSTALTVLNDFSDYRGDASGTQATYFAVSGPLSIAVPVIISGMLKVGAERPTGPGGSFAEASWSVSNYSALLSGPQGMAVSCSYGDATCGAYGFSTTATFTAFVNGSGGRIGSSTLKVHTLADAFAFRFYGDDGPEEYYGEASATAFADPFFQIDPTWAVDHPGYTLAFSSDLENGADPNAGAVPEPGSWALMTLGFAGVGASVRRRRRVIGAIA